MSMLLGDDKAFFGGMPSRHNPFVAAPIEDREDAVIDTPLPMWPPDCRPCPPPPLPHRHHVTFVVPSDGGTSVAKGPIESMAPIVESDYRAGWWWVVEKAGIYIGEQCEIGDMIFAISDKDIGYDERDFNVVQANHEVITESDIDQIMEG